MSGKSGPPMAQFRPVLARIAYRFVALQVDFFQYRERRARGIVAWFLEVKKEIPCLSNQPVRRAVATLRPSAALCDGELGYCSVLPLFFPLYDPLAMRVATHHVLGKFERKIRIQTLGSSIAPRLMPRAAGIHIEALLLPPLVLGTLRSLSHASVFGGFNNLELKLRPHGSLSKEMHHRFDIACILSG